jgi:hypothetical protein
VNDINALRAAARLQELGLVVKSPTLAARAAELNEFQARGGDRAMRRAAERGRRRRR